MITVCLTAVGALVDGTAVESWERQLTQTLTTVAASAEYGEGWDRDYDQNGPARREAGVATAVLGNELNSSTPQRRPDCLTRA